MNTESIHGIAKNGAKVEIGVVEHQGHKFEAMGSLVDHEAGRCFGYPSTDGKTLNTWDGQPMGPLEVTGKARGFHGVKLTCYKAKIDGHTYHGRGLGSGMLLKLRKGK